MVRRDREVRIKRAYETPEKADGFRVLVDRVWPRGVSKADAKLGEWLKDAGPSTELRHWFDHDPEKFDEFADRYRQELKGSESLARLRQLCREHDVVTLVYGAKDTEHNQAVVLRDLVSS